jgi:hypothetical protein
MRSDLFLLATRLNHGWDYNLVAVEPLELSQRAARVFRFAPMPDEWL